MLLIISIAMVGVVASAAEITSGGNGYINLKNFCVEGSQDVSSNKDGAYTYKRLNGDYAELRMMYLSDTNSGTPLKTDSGIPIWAYCIEFGQDINSANKRMAKTPEASEYWNSLSSESREAINLATVYGFPSSNLGVSAADAYAATQAVIWEFQTGIRSLSGGNRRSSVTYNDKFIVSTRFSSMFEDGLREKSGKSAYKLLLEKIYSHSVTPDFKTEIAELSFDDERGLYRLVLEDQNGVLQRYSITSSENELSVICNGNELILESKDEFENATLTFSKNFQGSYNQSALILEASGVGQVTYIGTVPCEVTCDLPVTLNERPEPTTVPETTTEPETTVLETTKPETTTEMETTTEVETTTEPITVTITEETPLAYVEEVADTSDPNSMGVVFTVSLASMAGFIIVNKARKC